MEEATLTGEEAGRPQRRDARENREALLAVAKRLFAAQGVEATSMAEIAREAGVGQGTLYRHFADKAALCQGLIGEDLEAFQERVGALLESASDLPPLERLGQLLAEKTRLVESHLPLFATMDLGPHRKGPSPFYAWQHEHISALLEEAVARGELAPLDVPFTAGAILTTVAPPFYRHQREDLGWSNERIVAGLRRMFVEGL